jgi:hypothetical protein
MRTVFALLITAALAAPAAAADALVLSGGSTADGLAPGAAFSSADPVRLEAGESLKVMLQSGAIVSLSGPHDGPLPVVASGSAELPGSLDTIGALLVGRSGTETVLGASRLAPAELPDVPTVWSIDTAASGPRCTNGTLQLHRADAEEPAAVVARTDKAKVGPVEWPAGARTLDLPQEALGTGGLLVVSVGYETRRFELQPMPPTIDETDEGVLLAWLASEGCVTQASALLEKIRGE